MKPGQGTTKCLALCVRASVAVCVFCVLTSCGMVTDSVTDVTPQVVTKPVNTDNTPTSAPRVVAQPVSEIEIGYVKHFIIPQISYQVDSVIACPSVEEFRGAKPNIAPAGWKYLFVRLTITNDSSRLLENNSDNFNIVTDDSKTFSQISDLYVPDDLLRSGEERGTREIQPGRPIYSTLIFLLPSNQINKHPMLVTRGMEGQLPLWPDRTQKSKHGVGWDLESDPQNTVSEEEGTENNIQQDGESDSSGEGE